MSGNTCHVGCNHDRDCPAQKELPPNEELLAAAEEVLLKLGTVDVRWNRLRAAIRALGGVA